MALVKAIGFEWQDVDKELQTTRSFVYLSTSPVRSGGAAARIPGYSFEKLAVFSFVLPSELSEFYMQFAYYVTGVASSSYAILRWNNGSTTLGGLKLNTNNKLEIWTGNMATKVATASQALTPNQWYVIELYIKIADSGGAIILRQDMVEVASFTGDTKPGSDTGVTYLYFHNTTSQSYFDDIIVHDTSGSYNNSWPAGGKVVLLRPDSDGATLDWTPTPSGSHYTTVNEVPPSATNYLNAGTSDLVDVLGLSDLGADAVTIKGVMAQAFALRGSDTPPTKLALGLRLGNTDYYSGDLTLGTGQSLVSAAWDSNPGGGPLSASDVNNAKLLLKSRS